MSLRVATFNVENLFTRPLAMKDGMGATGQAAIDHHAELNRIVARASSAMGGGGIPAAPSEPSEPSELASPSARAQVTRC